MSDQQLLVMIARGDRDAFAAFYDRHCARILGLLVRSHKTRADAEDVLQDTFWNVWQRAGRYDPARSTPDVWLFLIARSRSLDFLRQQRRRSSEPLEQPVSCLLDPAAIVSDSETGMRVREAIARLPEEQRTALCLAFFGGQTHVEVARQQAIPLGTAKTRILLAIRRLRGLLNEDRKAVSL